MLKYQFPAVKGCQAGKDYYICMVPLGLMSKIFVTDSSKHLLASLKPLVFIKDNRNRFFFQALVFGNRCLNGRLSMLAIVD